MLNSNSHSKTLSVSLLSMVLAPLALTYAPDARAVDVDAQCAAMYGSSFVPVTGRVTAASPTSARPAKGAINKDPNFGTCVVRATDHNADGAGTFARNDYSRRQAFNADNTRFLAYSYNGSWNLYDAKTLVRLKTLNGPAGDAEPQWHPTDPKSLYYIPTNGGTVLNKLDVETNTTTIAANFAGRLPWADAKRVWTKSEGSASADGRYWCFMAETDAFGIRGVFTYDLQTQTILGTRSMSNRPDHVSMSASGRSCVVSDGDVSGGVNAWDRTFTTSRRLHTIGEHSDLAIGADGSDYFVFVDYATTGDLVMVNVDTGVRTTLLPTYIEGTATAYHVSGKSFAKPGWVLLSTYANYGGPEKWLHQRVMAVELKANPTIINLAHHHSQYNAYWTEPHASVSRDFTRVLFSSNWGTTSDLDVDAFMIRLPDNLLGTATPPPPTPAPTCTRALPTVSLAGPTTAAAAGSTVNYSVSLKNNDSSACAATSFNLARTVPTGWTGTLAASSINLAPGVGSTTTLNVTSPTSATAGSYGIGTGVSSSVGTSHTASASGTYTVASTTAPPPSCTRAAPTISVAGPTTSVAPGSAVNYSVSLKNNDSSACAPTAFNLARTVPSGWTGTLAATSVSLAAGAGSTTTLTVTSTSNAAAGSYGIGSGVSSSASTSHTASASGTYAVAATSTAPPPATGPLSETVSTNKTSYRRGEIVQMTTRVMKNGVPVSGAYVYFTLFRPNNGGQVVKQATTASDGYARASVAMSTTTAAIGSYNLYASATFGSEGASASSTFKVN